MAASHPGDVRKWGRSGRRLRWRRPRLDCARFPLDCWSWLGHCAHKVEWWWMMPSLGRYDFIWGVPKMGYIDMYIPQNGWFTMETKNPIKMDDLGVPPFQETSIWFHRWGVAWEDEHHPARHRCTELSLQFRDSLSWFWVRKCCWMLLILIAFLLAPPWGA